MKFSQWSSSHKYTPLPLGSRDDAEEGKESWKERLEARRTQYLTVVAMAAALLLVSWALWGSSLANTNESCHDTIYNGYQCEDNVSINTQLWGQYSPYFSVPSNISAEIPAQCEVTFAQILSRHGARDPTSSKTKLYNATIQKIQSGATAYGAGYTFLKDYEYTLGADDLSVFGQQQMINSGTKYFNRYKSLAKHYDPFVRSSGSDRVVESAYNFTQGFHKARIASGAGDSAYPYNVVIISEDSGFNNTLDHGLCTSFEDGYDSTIGDSAQAIWAAIFTPNITARLNGNLPGANLTMAETIHMMDLCPFTTVSSEIGVITKFCSLFTEAEWRNYDYYESLGKYYGYGPGNPLGPTQGIGFTNELIARLTNTSVEDHTSTNSTLDGSETTFPLGRKLYADFSHDNDMTAIFSAMGLFNSTPTLLNTTIETATQLNGYSASWTVPFAARAYFEKMSCAGHEEELVRVIINDRVVPLTTCGGDHLGRCSVSAFVDSLSFAEAGGDWNQCFV
ncbi:hypothetical protein BP5796_01488 [Coleophoma crateriformis]|uniref:Phytase A n=1 Tax=Coleophoma crateriformis TaxID=565419 RepID=A0A3D8T0N0_9HELO|nr:hypothetical protein BP5796_01488 [Coleophoma crateriformis]